MIGVVVEVYNISTRELRRTHTVVGNVHYIEFNDAMTLKIQSPFDAILLRVYVTPPRQKVKNLKFYGFTNVGTH